MRNQWNTKRAYKHVSRYHTAIKSAMKGEKKQKKNEKYYCLRQFGLLFGALRRRRRTALLRLLNLLQDRILETLRLRNAAPTTDNFAIAIDEELLEIPLDPFESHDARFLALEPLEDGGGVAAVDVDFAQNRERDTVVHLAERLDLVIAAGVLIAELVAGETEDGERVRVLGINGFVELLKTLELRGKSALGGGVDDEDNFALQRGQGEGFAVF